LHQRIPSDLEVIQNYHQEFCSTVEETNKRLLKASQLLHQGLRQEAILFCEQAPHLLDVVTLLDIPEWDTWIDIVREHGLNAQPELLLDAAAELNQSYGDLDSLTDLLALHRGLALANAPLNNRIQVLYKIRNADPDTQFWEDDIREYEIKRHDQILQEIQVAYKSADCEQLASLERELLETNWLVAPSPKVKSQASAAHTRIRTQKSIEELEELSIKLMDAYTELDYEAACPLSQRWHGLTIIADLPDNHQLITKTEAALHWIKNETDERNKHNDHLQAVTELQQEIENEATQEVIEKRYYAATAHGYELPELLQQRYTDYLKYLTERSRRKFIILLSCAISCLLLISVLVGYGIIQQRRSTEITEHAQNLTALIDDVNLDQANKYWERIQDRNWLIESPQLQEVHSQLQEVMQSETSRTQRLDTVLDRIHSSLKEGIQWEQLDAVKQDSKAAEEIARTEEDTARIEKTKSQIWELEKTLVDKTDAEYKRVLQDVRQELRDVNLSNIPALSKIQNEIQLLKNRPRVSKELKSPLDLLETKVKEQIRIAQIESDKQYLFESMDRAVGNMRQFRSQMEAFNRKFPTSSQASSFSTIIENHLLDDTLIAQWEDISNVWSQIDFNSLSADQARAKLKQWEALQKNINTDNLLSEANHVVLKMLPYISARDDGQGTSIYGEVVESLGDPTISDINMLKTLDNKHYFFHAKIRKTSNNEIHLRAYTTLDLSEEKLVRPFPTPSSIVGGWNDEKDWLSPQSVFVNDVQASSVAIGQNRWDKTWISLLESLQNSQHMEPIIKFTLYRFVLKNVMQGSYPLQQIFKERFTILETAPVSPELNWFSNEDSVVLRKRKEAFAVLKKTVVTPDDKTKLDEFLESANKNQFGVPMRWIGWLNSTNEGKMQIRTGKNDLPQITGDFYTMVRDVENEPVRFVKIGQLQQSLPRVRLGLLSQLGNVSLVGRPVFLSETK